MQLKDYWLTPKILATIETWKNTDCLLPKSDYLKLLYKVLPPPSLNRYLAAFKSQDSRRLQSVREKRRMQSAGERLSLKGGLSAAGNAVTVLGFIFNFCRSERVGMTVECKLVSVQTPLWLVPHFTFYPALIFSLIWASSEPKYQHATVKLVIPPLWNLLPINTDPQCDMGMPIRICANTHTVNVSTQTLCKLRHLPSPFVSEPTVTSVCNHPF